MSYQIPENRLSGTGNLRLNGSVEYKFDHQRIKNMLLLSAIDLESSNAVVTNKTSIRAGSENPAPLFYKYRIGRGSKYVFVRPPIDSDAWRSLLLTINDIGDGDTLSASNVQAYATYMKDVVLSIRENINIVTRKGNQTNVSFDIGLIRPVYIDTSSEYFGSVFDVTIYTSERCNNGLTLMVNYPAFIPENNSIKTNNLEVLNAELIHELYEVSYSDTDQFYNATSDDSNTFTRKQYAVKFIMDE